MKTFNEKIESFKEFYNIDFCLLGKTENERKQNMTKSLEDILHGANLKHFYGA
jgi:hypothetical protein